MDERKFKEDFLRTCFIFNFLYYTFSLFSLSQKKNFFFYTYIMPQYSKPSLPLTDSITISKPIFQYGFFPPKPLILTEANIIGKFS